MMDYHPIKEESVLCEKNWSYTPTMQSRCGLSAAFPSLTIASQIYTSKVHVTGRDLPTGIHNIRFHSLHSALSLSVWSFWPLATWNNCYVRYNSDQCKRTTVLIYCKIPIITIGQNLLSEFYSITIS